MVRAAHKGKPSDGLEFPGGFLAYVPGSMAQSKPRNRVLGDRSPPRNRRAWQPVCATELQGAAPPGEVGGIGRRTVKVLALYRDPMGRAGC
jgi:hypothetical protein